MSVSAKNAEGKAMSHRSEFLLMCLFLGSLTALPHSAIAADWPNRSVTVIVPFGAGGNTDMMARLASQDLSAKFGQTFVVENRPSAGGALGTRAVASASPDGYTLEFAASSMVTLTPQVQKLDFDPAKELVPITNVGTGTQMLAIKRSLPAKTLPEFLEYAKANPGKLNFSVAGTQNISQLAPALLFARAGVNIVMVPARSEPEAISDLLAGNVDLYFGNSSSLLPYRDNENIRLIAVGTAQRIPAAPDIPAVAETLPGFEFSSWNGFLAPAHTPDPIVGVIRAEVTAFVQTLVISQRLIQLGIVPGGLTKEQNEAVFRHDTEAFAAGIKAAGITPQ
jgi:tripartite-type tricarboxylate transporter receptor subunit TctC